MMSYDLTRIIDPPLDEGSYAYGIGLYLVPHNYCSKQLLVPTATTTTTTQDPSVSTQGINEPTTKSLTQETSRSPTQAPIKSCYEGEFYTDAKDCVVYYQCIHGSLVSES